MLAAARNPIIITKALGRDPAAVPVLVRLAETLGAPVFEIQFHTYVNFPQDHALHGGFEAAPHLAEADAILVIESDVPWFPQMNRPKAETRVVHLGVDPLFSRYPVRGFPADLALAGTPRLALAALADAVARRVDRAAVAERRQRWTAAGGGGARPPPRRAGRSRATRPSTCSRSPARSGSWWTTARSWSTSTISTRPSAPSPGRAATSRRHPRAGSGGAWAPRSGPSWPRPITA